MIENLRRSRFSGGLAKTLRAQWFPRIFLVLGMMPLLALPPAVSAEDCTPWFFTSLPRDRDWFYGVAKNKDVGKARDLAVINLAKTAIGLIGEWDEAQIAEIAGPGYDAKQVAKEVGAILPTTGGLLSGWEQDDSAQCKRDSYVLVRIEKEQVKRFLAENDKLKARLRKAAVLPGMRKSDPPAPAKSDPAPAENLVHDQPLPEFHTFQPRYVPTKSVGEALTWGLLIPGGGQLYAGSYTGIYSLSYVSGLALVGLYYYEPHNVAAANINEVAHTARSKTTGCVFFALAGVVDLWAIFDGAALVAAETGAWSVTPTKGGVEVAWSRRF